MANPQKIRAEVKDIISFGRQVYKLVFQLEKRMPRFKAGQFLHFTLEEFDPTVGFWPESRVFSISSCSDDRKEVTIVYSVKGAYTRKMEEKLQIGKSVWLKAPYGEFIIPNYVNEGEKAVLIAGGTGVSPFIPYLKANDIKGNLELHYGIRDKSLILFEEELDKSLDNDNFKLFLYLEENDNSLNASHVDYSVSTGMLSIDSILKRQSDREQSVFFLSGPPTMIELFKEHLLKSDIKENKIIIDEWG